jgi:putative PEP-CTERM system TPR-repeat lipoprotein
MVACGRGDPASVVAEADRLLATGEYSEANVLLKKLVQEFPQDAAARARLAMIAMASGDFEAADSELARVDRSALRDAISLKARYQVDLVLGRYADVARNLAESQTVLDTHDRLVLLGHAQRGLGDRAAAVESYRGAAQSRGDSAEPVVGMSEVFVANGDFDKASETLDEFLKRQPKDPDALVARARSYALAGDFARAGAAFANAAANAGPAWPPAKRWSAKYQEGEAHLRRNDIAAAKLTLQELDKAVPGIAATRMLAARIALTEHRFADGIDELQRLSLAAPGNDTIEMLLAQAQLAGGSREQGALTLERLVSRSPRNAEAVKLLARVRLEQRRPDRALDLLQALPAEKVAADADFVALVSAARLQLGRPEEAIDALQEALANNPQNRAARLQLAAAQLGRSDPRAALKLLDELPPDVAVSQQTQLRTLALVASGDKERLEAWVKSLEGREAPGPDALAAAADVLVAVGRQDLARRVGARLAAVAGTNASLLMRVASIAAGERDWVEAEAALKKAVDADPRNVEVRVAIAQVALARGDKARAVSVLDEARRLDPSALAPHLLRAELYARDGNFERANSALDELMRVRPRDGVAAAAAGTLMLNAGRADESVARWTVAVEQQASAANLLGLARAQIALRQVDRARESLLRAAAARPDWATPVAMLTDLDVGVRRFDEALRRAGVFARKYPQSADALRTHGVALLAVSRASEAEAVFRKAYEISPSSALAVAQYRAMALQGIPRSQAPLIAWLARSPDDLATRALLAESYMLSGERTRAIAEYEDLLRRADDNVLALNNLAWLYAERGAFERAERLATRAFDLAPNATAVQDTLGWILVRQNKANEALPLLEKAATAAPNDPAIQYHFAAALARTGAADRARNVVQRALASEVGFDARGDAERLLGELRR